MLTVIIPAYNEEETLEEVIRRVLELRLRPQVIVVNDGSSDGTGKIVDELARRGEIAGVHLARNCGKGAAIRAGLELAERPYTIIQDADLEYDPAEYAKLMQPILAGKARVVFGSRNLHNPAARRNDFHYLRFWLGGKIVTLAANLMFGARLTDEATCFKVFPTELLRRMNLQARGFEFCPEVTAKALRMGERIIEVPIGYRPRSLDEGKKIRAIDGIKAIGVLAKYRVMPAAWLLRNWGDAAELAGAKVVLPANRQAA